MRGNVLNLKLLHLNDQLLNDYYTLLVTGKVRMPLDESSSVGGKPLRAMSFLQTEDSKKPELRKRFDELSAAKILVDGIVVPHLVLTSQRHVTSLFEHASPMSR